MALGGDPEALRASARRLRGHADRLVETSDRLTAGEDVHWKGTAGDSFRAKLREHGTKVSGTRDTVVEAATAMDHLADEVEQRQAAIRRAMAEVDARIDDAVGTINGLAGQAWDALTGVEQAAERQARGVLDTVGKTLPPVGHPDYLDLARRLGGGR